MTLLVDGERNCRKSASVMIGVVAALAWTKLAVTGAVTVLLVIAPGGAGADGEEGGRVEEEEEGGEF